jgi:rhomboid family GlyGly-CTERM serine protease
VTRGVAGWLALCIVLAAGSIAARWAPASVLAWQPTTVLAEPWRAWTAAFEHLSLRHLVANLIGCGVVGAFGAAARVPPRAAWAWLAAWPLCHLALALQPALTRYAGASGVLHAGVAVAAWHLLRHEPGRRRAIGAAVLIGLTLKIALEAPWAAPTQRVPGWDFAVAPLAHATGALAGLACAWLADALARGRR